MPAALRADALSVLVPKLGLFQEVSELPSSLPSCPLANPALKCL